MKINWTLIILAILIGAAFFLLGRCSSGKGKQGGAQTVPAEVVYLPGKKTVIIDTHYVPVPIKGVRKVVEIDNFKTDTVEVPVIVEVSEGTAYYRDSLPVSHGYAIIQDTVSENRITGRGFRLNQALPTVERTIPEKKRNVVYLGVSGTGGKQNYLYSVSGDISLKDKRDRMWSIAGHVTVDNRFLIGAGIRWPVRWRR